LPIKLASINKGLILHLDPTSSRIDNSTIRDCSPYRNHGSINGAVLSEGLEFDGVDDYVKVLDSPSISPTEAITLEAWALCDTIPGDWSRNRIMFKSRAYNFQVGVTNKFRFELYVDGAYRGLEASAVSTTTVFQHWVATYDSATRIMILYLNGQEVASKTLSGLTTYLINDSPDNLLISHTAGYHDGIIASARIYNRVLSASEITQNYNETRYGARSNIRTGLVLELIPSSVEGLTWRDISGQGNSGSIKGASWVSRGLSFDGVDDYVDLSDTGTEWNFQTFSASFWIATTDANSQEIMGEGGKWRPLVDPGGELVFWIRGLKAGTDAVDILWGSIINDGDWHHAVVTYDVNTLKMQIYLDGVLDAEKLTEVEIYADAGNNQAIGRGYTTSPNSIAANIGDVRIFNRVLSAEEVSYLYKLGKVRFG